MFGYLRQRTNRGTPGSAAGGLIVSDIDLQATSDTTVDQAKRDATNFLLRRHRVTAEDFTIDDIQSFLKGLNTFAQGLSIVVGIVDAIEVDAEASRVVAVPGRVVRTRAVLVGAGADQLFPDGGFELAAVGKWLQRRRLEIFRRGVGSQSGAGRA